MLLITLSTLQFVIVAGFQVLGFIAVVLGFVTFVREQIAVLKERLSNVEKKLDHIDEQKTKLEDDVRNNLRSLQEQINVSNKETTAQYYKIEIKLTEIIKQKQQL